MRKVKTEITAKIELTTDAGERVLMWVTDREPGEVSLAVPGDRARLTPNDARSLAEKLNALASLPPMSLNLPTPDTSTLAGRTATRLPWEHR